MNRLIALAAACLFAIPAIAQPPQPGPNADCQSAIKKLGYLVGEWEGDAEMNLGPGRTEKVRQHEKVELRLQGTILVIEGTGRGKLPNGTEGIVFNALATVTFDPKDKKYGLRAHRMEGMKVDCDLNITDNGFIWGFKEPARGTRIRYTMTHLDGVWKEIGEYSLDEKTYTKFFEMNLKKITK